MNTQPSTFTFETLTSGSDILAGLTRNRAPAQPTLAAFLKEIEPLPRRSVVIGACDDGLPVLMDLSNPRLGSILIIGDPSSGKTGLLASILHSACTTIPARSLRVSCISTRPAQLEAIARLPHAYQLSSPENTIIELARIVKDRSSLGAIEPAVLLAIDDLPALLGYLPPELVHLLAEIIHHGPQVHVRVIATAESGELPALGEAMLDSFGAWLCGKVDSCPDGMNLALIPPETSLKLKPGAQFCVYSENDWLPFWVLH